MFVVLLFGKLLCFQFFTVYSCRLDLGRSMQSFLNASGLILVYKTIYVKGHLPRRSYPSFAYYTLNRH